MITECRSPITAISMIITMVGTAATPLITALQNSALTGLQAAGGLCSALTRWRSSTCPWASGRSAGPRSANSGNSRHLFEFGQA